MIKLLFILPFLLLAAGCQVQDERSHQKFSVNPVGGPCEGCEAVYEYGDKRLSPVDTLPDFHEEGQRLQITGTIYQSDGKTPAEGVILYVYHTNQAGIYPTKGGETGWAKRHGYIRGWVKTNADGKYTLYTLRPGTYPSRSEPAHIHATIKEPEINEYYLADYHFADDPLLTAEDRNPSPRGGSGVLYPQKENDIWVAERDIVLGLNIPDYP